MIGISQIIPEVRDLTVRMSGTDLKGNRIVRQYTVVCWALYCDSSGEIYEKGEQYVTPLVIADDMYPITMVDLDKDLQKEGIEGTKYHYMRNGELIKKEVIPEKLKPLKRHF